MVSLHDAKVVYTRAHTDTVICSLRTAAVIMVATIIEQVSYQPSLPKHICYCKRTLTIYYRTV